MKKAKKIRPEFREFYALQKKLLGRVRYKIVTFRYLGRREYYYDHYGHFGTYICRRFIGNEDRLVLWLADRFNSLRRTEHE